MAVFYGWEKTRTSSEDTRSAGTIIGRVSTTTVSRMPDNIMLREQKDTYLSAPLGSGFSGSGLALAKSDVKTCTWDASVYGPTGPVNQPKERSEIVRSFAWVSDAGASPTWVEVSKTETAFGYDGITGHVAVQTTTKWTRQKLTSGYGLLPQTMQVKTTREQGPGWTVVSTDSQTWDSRTGTWVADTAGSGDVGIGGGRPAGGTRSGGR